MTDRSSCTDEEHESSTLAYKVYVDRLMFFITGYLSKLLGSLDVNEIDGIVFSGGIGEKSDHLRRDVADRLKWTGIEVDDSANTKASKGADTVTAIHSDGSKIGLYVVQTDEEEVCARMTREELGL
jgi:acetate kinase